jgi:hypothetical protein
VRVPAFRSVGVQLAGCGIAVAVLAADQVSKPLMLAAHPGPGNGPISVRLVRNTGASFGLGAGHPLVILLVTLAIIVVVAWLMTRTTTAIIALLLAAAQPSTDSMSRDTRPASTSRTLPSGPELSARPP